MDHLSSELAFNDSKQIIEKPEKFENNKSEKTKNINILVRDIIISHLNEEYYKRILSLNEPADTLKKIREIYLKKKTNITDTMSEKNCMLSKGSHGGKFELWYCYVCMDLKKHKGNDCPNKT